MTSVTTTRLYCSPVFPKPEQPKARSTWLRFTRVSILLYHGRNKRVRSGTTALNVAIRLPPLIQKSASRRISSFKLRLRVKDEVRIGRNKMAAQPGVQEILAKIRARVQERAPRPIPSKIAGEVSDAVVESRRGYDTTNLRLNLHDCNLFHNAVGTLNPRNPGLLNQAIQFIKRMMNRSLTWYTRPLNEITKALESLDATMRRMETNIQNRDAQNSEFRRATEQRIADLQRAIEDIRRQNDRGRQEARQPQRGLAAGKRQDAESLASGRTGIGSGQNVLEIKTQAGSRSPAAEQQR